MKFGLKFLAVASVLTCGACASQSNTPVAVDVNSPQIIRGPAPVPTPGSMSRPTDYSQDSGMPTLPDDNPGSGLTLGRSRPF